MKISVILAVTAAMLGTAAHAQSGPSGSAQLATYRSCASKGAADPCSGDDRDPSQAILRQVYAGGLGKFTSNSLEIDRPGTAEDAYARSSVALGAFNLPQIRGETRAGPADRMNINAFGFQTFTWTGAEATPFSLAATLHVVDSSVSQPDYVVTEANGDRAVRPGSDLPGGAYYRSYVGIWDPAIIDGLTTAEQLFDKLFLAGCSTPGVLGVRNGVGSLGGGEFSRSISTGACVNGTFTTNTLVLQPGQRILTIAALQLPVNRGGFIDATHTFTTMIDPALPEAVRAGLIANLVPASAVPEPASWTLMIAGFGLLGSTLRRRRQTRATGRPAFCRA